MNSQAFDPVRIGVVGMGSFGTLHALTVAGLAESRLVAVVARRQASLDTFDAQYAGGVRGWLDLAQAVEESDAEAWVIASSTHTHVSMVQTILAAGKPVLVEKPLSQTITEAESLADTVAQSASPLMMGHILLFNSEFRQLQDEVRTRGPLRFLNAVRHRPVETMKMLLGETPYELLMVHDLYATLALVDRAEPVAFSSQVHRTDGDEIDLALGQLQWPDGTTASYSASFMTTVGMPPDGFDRLEVFGEGWVARVSSNPRPIELWDDRAQWPMALEIRADPEAPMGMMAEELRCFCRVVRGRQTVPVGATYEDALQVQRWLALLQDSVVS